MIQLTGKSVLTRLALRRDRILIPLWLLAVFGLMVIAMWSLLALYPTEAERTESAVSRAALPVLRAIKGNPAGDSPGALAVHEMYIYVAVMTALMSIFIVVRHTRQNEETGRSEMISSGVVGRYAPLTAGLLTALVANLGIFCAVVLGLLINGTPLVGSLAAGTGVAGVGLVFAAVAAVTAQLYETARGASGLALTVAGVAYLLRSVGDAAGTVESSHVQVASSWSSWVSPLGWGQLISAFHAERWWVTFLFLGATLGLIAVAVLLVKRRDVGMSLLPTRPGPAQATPGLLSVFGLTWRLQSRTLLAWIIGLGVTGALFGVIGADADQLAAHDDQIENFLTTLGGTEADPRKVFFGATLSILGIAVAGYAAQALLRMRDEEASTLEAVLATTVSRQRWMLSHVLCTFLGVITLLTVVGAAAGITSGLVLGHAASQLGQLLAVAVSEIPAALAFAGFVTLAFGLLPRLASTISWAGLATATALAGLAGAVALTDGAFQLPFGIPASVLAISPFAHTSTLAAGTPTVTNVLALIGAAIVFTGIATLAFRRRDLAL